MKSKTELDSKFDYPEDKEYTRYVIRDVIFVVIFAVVIVFCLILSAATQFGGVTIPCWMDL